jgi:hypothetical protein
VAWSPELSAKLLEIAETKVAMYDAAASEMEQTPWDETYLQQHRRSFGSRPIRVLTSGNHGVGHLETKPADTPEHVKYEQETTLAQARWLTLSSNTKQIFARHSSEYIQFDEPEPSVKCMTRQKDRSWEDGRLAHETGQVSPHVCASNNFSDWMLVLTNALSLSVVTLLPGCVYSQRRRARSRVSHLMLYKSMDLCQHSVRQLAK